MSNTRHYEFEVQGIDPGVFTVVSFKGTESISSLYSFTVMLISQTEILSGTGSAPQSGATPKPRFQDVVNNPATLRFLFPEESADTKGKKAEPQEIGGIVEQLEFMRERQGYYLYKATLRPRHCRMTKTHFNTIFLNKTTAQIIENAFTDSMLTSQDYEIAVKSSEEKAWDYVCMFNESPFHFISQRMERNGIYYFFKQTQSGEKMFVVDDSIAHEPILGETAEFLHPWEPDMAAGARVVHSLHEVQRVVPQKVTVRDYNYELANISIEGSHVIEQDNAQGELYFYGEHARSTEEAKTLATVRAEEQLCRQVQYNGISTIPAFRSGHTFTLQGHGVASMNKEYLITEVQHSGHQSGYLHGSFGLVVEKGRESEPVYSNSFVCQDADRQYRPLRVTEKSRFHGMLSAVVDGQGEEGKPHLDEQGRYKVIMPFDLSGRKDGNASCWLRLMHPYAGKDVTFHFPLLKGTEVLIAFIDGDPDRPVIAGALHNSESPSLVTSKNPYLNTIETSSKQEILISDAPNNTYTAVGSSNKKIAKKHDHEEEEFAEFTAGSKYEITLGNSDELILGNKIEAQIGTSIDMKVAPQFCMEFGPSYKYTVNVPHSKRESMVYEKIPDVSPAGWSSAALGSYLLPMEVVYSNVDGFDFGDGHSFCAKATEETLGQEKATLYGGTATEVKDALDQVSSKVSKLVALAALGGAAASVAEGYASYKLKEAKMMDFDNKLVSNTVSTVAGCLLPAAVAVKANKLLTTVFKSAKKLIEEENLVGGKVQCDCDGVTIQANNPVVAPNLLNAKVSISTKGQSEMGQIASLVLAKMGEQIKLSRGNDLDPEGTCSLTMKNDTVTIKGIKGVSEGSFTLGNNSMQLSLPTLNVGTKLSAGKVNLWANEVSKVDITEAGVTAQANETTKITIEEAGITAQVEETSCNISAEAVNFSVAGSTFVTDSSGITHTAANVRINGAIVDIG